MNDRIRFALVGTGKRSDTVYAPLLNTLKADVELVGVWDRSEDKGRAFGEKYQIPWFTDLDRLRNDLDLDAVVSTLFDDQCHKRLCEGGASTLNPAILLFGFFWGRLLRLNLIHFVDTVYVMLRDDKFGR